MKKTKLLVITAIFTLAMTSTVSASLPENSIVVGNNVYDLTYLTTHSGAMQTVNDEIMNNLNSIYFVGSDGNAVDIFTGSKVSDSQIAAKSGSTLTFTPKDGGTQKILMGADGQYGDPVYQNNPMYAIANVSYKSLSTGFYVFNFKVNQLTGVSNAAYFRAANSGLVALTDTATYVGALSSGDQIQIYASDGITELAFGTIGLDTSSGTTGQQNISITLTSTVASDPTADSIKGNTAVNIVNTGFAAVDQNNQWIYYSNTADSNKLYKQSVTGLDNYVISDDNVKYINVVGDWVYYSNFNDSGKIYKVKTDGTQKQKITDDMASYVNVVGNKIYYINNSDRARIYVLDSQGERQLIGDSASGLSVTGNYLFYINQSDSNKLYNYNLLNSIKSKISDVKTKFINATTDYAIFYTGVDGVLYKSTNSGESTAIPMSVITNIAQKASTNGVTYKSTSDKLTNICSIDDGNIYYTSYADGSKIYKLDDTGNGYKVVDDSADYMNIINSTLYYLKGGKAYTADLNGSSTQKGTAIAKPKLTTKISSIETIPTLTVSNINTVSFPDRVSCMMSDGTIQELVVTWDKTIPKPSKGIYTFNGTILGYGNKVSLAVALDSGTVDVTNNNVVVTNNAGSTDTVTVDSLNTGDIINVYMNQSDTKATKSGTADANGKVSISGLNLNVNGGYLYMTITKSGKAEGQKLAVPYGPEVPINFSIDAQNGKITGLKSGYQYKVYLDSKDSSGKLPSISKANLLTSTPLTADSSGTISLDLKTPIGNSQSLMLRLMANSGNGSVYSNPSTAVEVGKQTVPSYVSTDLNLGRITGTTTTMQYSYDGSTGWTNCTNGSTSVSMTRSLQVFVKLKANGPYLESDPKQLPLFPAPEVKGITDGSTYSVAPKISWPVNDLDTSDSVTTTYSVKLEKVTSVDSSGNNVYSTVSLGTVSGNSLDLSSVITSSTITGDGYKLTVTATRNVYGSTTMTANANTVINFVISSAKPAPVDITFNETPGTIGSGETESSGAAIPTYYQATPIWNNLAGTYSSATIKMLKIPTGTDGAVTYSTVNSPAEVAFVKGTTVTQNGEYILTVTTTNKENGASITTTKAFIVENIDKALSPTITNIDNGGVYTDRMNGIDIVDKPNCTTKVTIMKDGYITDYTKETALTVNGNYVLVLDTTNNINGATVEEKITFTINNGATNTTPDAPTGVTFSFDNNQLNGVTTDEEYSLNAGGSWTSVTATGTQVLTTAEINTLNSDPNNEILIRKRANGSTPASASQIISLTKPSAPSGITFSFDGTNANQLKNATTDMQYSLDGGINWTTVTSNDQVLTSTEVASITASNDIKIRYKAQGTNKISNSSVIDIIQASAPSLTSSIDTAGNVTITGATTTMEYRVNSGSWQDASSSISIPSAAAGTTIEVRSKASGTAMSGSTSTITVQAAPVVTIDYTNEKVTGVSSTMEWSKDGTNWTPVSGTTIDISSIIPDYGSGQAPIYIRKKVTSTSVGVAYQVNLDPRPQEPNPVIAAGSITGKTSITADSTLEYTIIDSTKTITKQDWTTGTGSAVDSTTLVTVGDYIQIRVKATSNSFASKNYEYQLVSTDIKS